MEYIIYAYLVGIIPCWLVVAFYLDTEKGIKSYKLFFSSLVVSLLWPLIFLTMLFFKIIL